MLWPLGVWILLVWFLIVAPILIISNSKKIKQMDRMIADFEGRQFATTEEKEKEKEQLKNELTKIYSGIKADKELAAKAREKIETL